MSKSKLVWRQEAFRELRTLPTMQAIVQSEAEDLATRCGRDKGYVAAITSTPRNRARAAVIAASPHARRDNAKHQTLLRQLGARGG